jgi:uncharacterized phiE125 gp8 family phage protein
MPVRTLITPPTAEPVSVVEAAQYCRIDGNDFDLQLAGKITAARMLVETATGRTLMPTTWRLTMDKFPYPAIGKVPMDRDYEIRLPGAPLVSVTNILWQDYSGVIQTMDPTTYIVDPASEPGRIALAYLSFWPFPIPQQNAITIDYIAGYPDAAHVPYGLKLVILMLVAHWHRNPDAAGATLSEAPMAVAALLANYDVGQVW